MEPVVARDVVGRRGREIGAEHGLPQREARVGAHRLRRRVDPRERDEPREEDEERDDARARIRAAQRAAEGGEPEGRGARRECERRGGDESRYAARPAVDAPCDREGDADRCDGDPCKRDDGPRARERPDEPRGREPEDRGTKRPRGARGAGEPGRDREERGQGPEERGARAPYGSRPWQIASAWIA